MILTLKFLANGNFCCLLTTFANSLDPDQDRQNVGSDLDTNFLKKLILKLEPSSESILLTIPRRCFFCGSFLLVYASCWCVSVPCSLVVTCWERADLLAVVFCHFPKCFLVHIRIKG